MGEAELDLRNIAGLLRRQSRIILATVVAVMGLAMLGAFALTPVFSASALVLVDPRTKDLLNPDAAFGNAGADSARIDSEVEILRSDRILLLAIAAEDLVGDPEFSPLSDWRSRLLTLFRPGTSSEPDGEQALTDTLNALRRAIGVERRDKTYLIAVEARSTDPHKAAALANALTQAYIGEQLDAKVGAVLASRDILQKRAGQARAALAQQESAFDDVIQASITRIAGNGGLIGLQRQVAALTADRARQDALLADAEARRDDEAEIETLRASLDRIVEEERGLRETLRQHVLASPLPPDVLTELYAVQQNAALARTQYQTLLARVQDLDAQAGLQIADSRIVSPALPAQAPSFPNRSLILQVAAVLGIGLGVALAFLYENLIGGFTSPEQVETLLKTRMATAIPRQTARASHASLADLMVDEPLSPFAEAVRRIRVGIDRPGARSASTDEASPAGQVIMVSSTAPGEGKTTIALALARSFALSGQRTLIIDCDLRKPSIHQHLRVEKSVGLAEYLDNLRAGSDDLISTLSNDTLSELTAIVGARRSTLPTDQLLASRQFDMLICAARGSFDVLILDTPPVGPVVDGLYIAPFADVIVFLAKWSSTPQTDARRALESLRRTSRSDSEIITVLNQESQSRSAYYRKYGSYLTQMG